MTTQEINSINEMVEKLIANTKKLITIESVNKGINHVENLLAKETNEHTCLMLTKYLQRVKKEILPTFN